MKTGSKQKETYEKPKLTRMENIRKITCECPDWQCSVVVPPEPHASQHN